MLAHHTSMVRHMSNNYDIIGYQINIWEYPIMSQDIGRSAFKLALSNLFINQLLVSSGYPKISLEV